MGVQTAFDFETVREAAHQEAVHQEAAGQEAAQRASVDAVRLPVSRHATPELGLAEPGLADVETGRGVPKPVLKRKPAVSSPHDPRAGQILRETLARTQVPAPIEILEDVPERVMSEREMSDVNPEVSSWAESRPRLTRVSLQQWLQRMCGPHVVVLITNNERTMISTRAGRGELVVRVHHMFLEADAGTLSALAGYLNKNDPDAGQGLLAFVKRNRERIRRQPNRRIALRSGGSHHRLQEIYDEINRVYFSDRVQASITWGRHGTSQRRSRRSIKFGSYHSAQRLIRIHPVLDAAWVPAFFVAYIVYHEMLHEVIPPETRGGRNEYHGPKFRACEKLFAQYSEALAWEYKHLNRLLRS